jgi:hypothetical protein
VFSNFTPAPAATKEARVEILKVSFPSPPVPHRSMCYSPINQHVYTIPKASLKPESSSMLMLRIMKTVKKAEI